MHACNPRIWEVKVCGQTWRWKGTTRPVVQWFEVSFVYKVPLKSVTATGDPVSNKQCFFACEKRLPHGQVEEPYLY